MRRLVNYVGGVLVGLVFAIHASSVQGQDWPQWRGPEGNAAVKGFNPHKAWPKKLTEKWSVPVGSGVSSPILVGGNIYAHGRIGGDEVTTCIDASSGKVVWQEKYTTRAAGGAASGYGGPRSTAAAADGKIFTLGVNGTVTCHDAAKGTVLWRKETGEKPQFATSSSPLIVDGKCIVFLDVLTAFDVSSGDVKWKGPSGTPYGSPTLMSVAGRKMIVTPTSNSLVGVNSADGKTLWQVKLPGFGYHSNYSTPIVQGQTIIYFAPARGAGGTAFAIQVNQSGDAFTTTEKWKGTGAYQYNTPVLKDNLLFGLSADKRFFCMDAKSGKTLWSDDTARGEAGGVVSAGNLLVAVTGPTASGGGKGRGGRSESAKGDVVLTVFEASGARYKELVHYKLSPGSGLAYPIVAAGRVYVKGNDTLTLWGIE